MGRVPAADRGGASVTTAGRSARAQEVRSWSFMTETAPFAHEHCRDPNMGESVDSAFRARIGGPTRRAWPGLAYTHPTPAGCGTSFSRAEPRDPRIRSLGTLGVRGRGEENFSLRRCVQQ